MNLAVVPLLVVHIILTHRPKPCFHTADQLMNSVATTVRDGAITEVVATKALEVTGVIVRGMEEATRSGHTEDIVESTVEVFQGEEFQS